VLHQLIGLHLLISGCVIIFNIITIYVAFRGFLISVYWRLFQRGKAAGVVKLTAAPFVEVRSMWHYPFMSPYAISAAPHLIMNQCRTQQCLQAVYCLWFRQGRWTVPGGRTAVGLGARGCSAAALLPPSWCEVSRPYSPLLCAKTLRSLRRNLALRFWNQTCKRAS